MSSSDSDTAPLIEKQFEFEVKLEDPPTGLTPSVNCEVDTGNPTAIMLPRYFDHFFSDFQGTADFKGAGGKNSTAYKAGLKQIGNIRLDEPVLLFCGLDESDYGLIGIDVLKFMETRIYDDPHAKKLKLTNTHF